jgi:hypothetical protein
MLHRDGVQSKTALSPVGELAQHQFEETPLKTEAPMEAIEAVRAEIETLRT